MARKRAKTKNRLEPVADWKITFLATGRMPTEGVEKLELFMWRHPGGEKKREDWLKYREMILPGYIAKYPGKRPWGWWKFSAPRWERPFPGWFFDGQLPEPREKVAGKGVLSWEKYNSIIPRFEFGIPVDWHEIDMSDPPLFEAEASYLKRHKLLSKSEEKRLKPGDFEPESCLEYIKTYEKL